MRPVGQAQCIAHCAYARHLDEGSRDGTGVHTNRIAAWAASQTRAEKGLDLGVELRHAQQVEQLRQASRSQPCDRILKLLLVDALVHHILGMHHTVERQENPLEPCWRTGHIVDVNGGTRLRTIFLGCMCTDFAR